MSVAKSKEKPYTLSDEARGILHDILNEIWEEIAWDIFNAIEEQNKLERKKGPVEMPRDEVIEVVLDAGRPEQKLEEEIRTLIRRGKDSSAAKEALSVFKTLSYDQMIAEAKKVFLHTRYGR